MKNKIYQCWVKKQISKPNWNSWYSQNNSYCNLSEDAIGVWIGFVVGNENPNFIPENCFRMSDDELRRVDFYRRSHRVEPYPFQDISVAKKTISQKTSEALIELGKNVKELLNKISVTKPIEKTNRENRTPTKGVDVSKIF